MNILIAGIPSPDLISHIGVRYGEDVRLFVAESRPFEENVAQGVAAQAGGGEAYPQPAETPGRRGVAECRDDVTHGEGTGPGGEQGVGGKCDC